MKNNENNRCDENRQIDDLFRNGLNDLRPEPSKDLWKGISRKLWWDEISHFTFTNLSSVLWIGGFAGLAVIVAVIVIATIPQNAVTNGIFVQNLSGPSNLITPELQSAFSSTVSTNALYVRKNETEPQVDQVNNPSAIPLVNPLLNVKRKSIKPKLTENKLAANGPVTLELYQKTESGTFQNPEQNPSLYMQTIGFSELNSSLVSDTLRLITPQMILNVPKVTIAPASFFSLAFGLSPEVLQYKTNDLNSEMTFYGNAGIAYQIGRFSIRSGVGLGYVNTDGIYRVDYKSKDSVGYYNSVISYAISQANPKEIVYITQTMVVYDSLSHIADDKTRNRYTYLQVPLLIGFRVLETHRIGLMIETGPTVSFLVGKKEAAPEFTFSNARIIRVDKNTPERNETTWQLYAGLRFDYQMTKSLSIYAEPYYKYYLKSPAIQNENTTKNPYALGIGVGIQYYFGQKHQ